MRLPIVFRSVACLITGLVGLLLGPTASAADFVLSYAMQQPYCGNNGPSFVSGPGVCPFPWLSRDPEVGGFPGIITLPHVGRYPWLKVRDLLRFSVGAGAGCNNIRADSGNYRREVLDLEVWGGVGEQPLVWKRYFNSRPGGLAEFFGGAASWRHSYHWSVSGDTNSLRIYYPDGTRNDFTMGANGYMEAAAAIPDKVLISGDELVLLRQNGWRYRVVNDTNFGYLVVGLWDSQENYTTYDYNTNGQVSRVTEPAGRYLNITYGTNEFPGLFGSDNIARVDGSDGRYVTYSYTNYTNSGTPVTVLSSVSYGDGTSALLQHADGSWPLLTNSYEPRSISGPVHAQLIYWTAWALFRAEINPDTGIATRGTGADDATGTRVIVSAGGTVEPVVYSQGLLTSRTNGGGGATSYAYENGNGFLISKTDPLGRTTYYTNSVLGNHTAVTYPDNTVEQWTLDEIDQPLGYTNALGQVTSYTRDSRHRTTRVDYPDGTYETYTYNTNSQLLSQRLTTGGTNTYGYSTNGLKTSATNALGQVTTFTYDACDRLVSMTDARGNTTSNFYNWRGQIVATVNPDATYKTFGYDTNGNKVAETNELGNVTLYTYDNFRRLVSQTDPLSRTTTFEYAEFGGCCGSRRIDSEPAVITSPLTNITVNGFDLAGRKISTVSAWGTAYAATNQLYYDDAGNVTLTVNPLGNSTTNTFDDRNRRLSTSDSLGNTTSWVYDAAGRKVKEIRANSTTNFFGYDSRNRLLAQTNALGHITQYSYDSGGNLASLTDARSNVYSFTYDVLNRKTAMTYPNSSQETWTYDAVGNVTNYATRASQVKTAVFDSRNRETSCSWSDGSPGVTRIFDAVGRLLVQSNSISVITNVFDAAGQLTSETQLPLALNSYWTIAYGYDADGRRVTVGYPGGLNVTNTYTPRNQLENLYTGYASPTASFTYDRAGNRTAKILENSTTNLLAYDVLNRLTNSTHLGTNGTLGSFRYGYDSVHRPTYMQVDANLGDVFAYDNEDQVTGVQYDATNPDTTPSSPARTVSYGFDPVGNRTNVTDNGAGTSYTANNLNQYTAVGAASPTYDANGNLTNYLGWGYAYDAQNRLWGAANTNTSGTFTYDAKNRVVSRIVNGTTNYYFYDDWSLVQEVSAAAAVLQTYVHGPRLDEMIFKTDGSNLVYYHYDALGNVTHLTDSYSRVVERYRYDIYGKATIKDGGGNTLTATAYGNRFQFTGREYLADFGLHDYRNRVYLQTWGRFIQTDPIRFDAKDVNVYRYIGNAPNLGSDPNGLMSLFPLFDKAEITKGIGAMSSLNDQINDLMRRGTVEALATAGELKAGYMDIQQSTLDHIANMEKAGGKYAREADTYRKTMRGLGLLGAALSIASLSAQASEMDSQSDELISDVQEWNGHRQGGDFAMAELDAIDIAIDVQTMSGDMFLTYAIWDSIAE